MNRKIKAMLQLAAVFIIYIVVNMTIANALTINFNPANDVNATSAQAEIKWTTDLPSDSKVDYGLSTGLGSSEADSNKVASHSMILTGLGAAATYYYKLTSSTANESATADNSGSLYSFTTRNAATAPPQFNVSLPAYYNRRQITFGGFTTPDSVLKLYINPNPADIGTDKYAQLTTSDSSGHFIFKYINLQPVNDMVIWARDSSGNVNTARYTLIVDTEDPVVKLADIPSLVATTTYKLNGTINENVTITYSINNNTRTETSPRGAFSLQLALKEGSNKVDIQFSDRAGNVFEKEFTITVDTQGPRILWDNMGSLDPSYIEEVDIQGNVSKPGATVIIFVNNKTQSSESWSTSVRDMLVHYGSILGEGNKEYVTKADANGHFKIRVFLTQEIASKKTEYQQNVLKTAPAPGVGGPGGGPTSVGTSKTATGTMTTGSTGRYSNAWDNNILIVAFDELGRSDKRPGVITFARCGYGADWNILVKNPTPSVIIPEHLKQGLAQVAFAVNLDWQGPGAKQKLTRDPIITPYKLSEDIRKKYALDPNELLSKSPKAVWSPDRKRGYVVLELNKKDYEQKKLSELKKEDLFIRLPMQMELEYSYDDGSGNVVTSVQKQCWDVSVMLDVKVPPSVIPKELLNASVIFLNETINAINRILQPLKAITIATFVTCLLSWVMYFFALMKKAYDCMDSKKGNESQSCKESKESAQKVEKYMHYVCDRIFCPSVPTADYYFQQMSPTDECKKGLTPGMDKTQGCGKEYMDQWDSGCLLMDELKRSKCIRYEEGDSRFQSSCEESGWGAFKKVWYGASDFCRKKDQTNPSRRVSILRGKENEEWIIDDQGKAHKVGSIVTEIPTGKQGATVGDGGAKTTYTYAALGEYSEGGKSYSDKITYDEQGRMYYPTDSKGGKQYVCESQQTGKLQGINPDREGKLVSSECKGGSPATLPPEIMTTLNLPATRKYVVNPTDNLLTSLQCVCLPGINGFLTMWRNMLGAIMQCFQSILITGEGNTGLCRAVLTTYVCDIIFNAIRCFVNRFGGGDTSREDAPGRSISKFFKSAATAGGDIQKSITGRYGESGLYKTMFSERKLIHAACLYAFTGDFDFDIGSALTGPGAIPLKSKAFLYPRNRRFLSSNPLNGLTTHIYHVGAGLVAGADMGYKLQLVCSSGNSCDIKEGFPNGDCDCTKQGKEIVRDITYAFGPGRLVAGEMLGPNEGDIYVKLADEKYRYDKVRLTYWYKDNNGAQKTEVEEQPISQIGGNPPAECSFDLLSGSFRCAYEIGDVGYAIFTEVPKPVEKVYGIGGIITLNFKVDKRSPQKPKEEGVITSYDSVPFYLRYIVTSPQGEKLDEKVVPIIEDGVQDISGKYPNIKVTEDMLMGRGVGKDYEVIASAPEGADKAVPANNYDSSGRTQTLPLHFAVYMQETTTKKNAKADERVFEVKVCDVDIKQEETKKGELKDAFNVKTCSKIVSGQEGKDGEMSFGTWPYKESVRIIYKGIWVDVKYSSIPLKSSKSSKNEFAGGFIMREKLGNVQTSIDCKTKYTSATRALIGIKIGLYPCQKKKEDEPMTLSNCQADTTPVNYFDQVQEYDISVDAICSKSGEEGVKQLCPINVRLSDECECRAERIGRANCALQGKKENYCVYYGVGDYECKQYISCPSSNPPKQPVKIDSSTYATEIQKGAAPHYYCDCKGQASMQDCTNKYCYEKGGQWDCYEAPPMG